MEQRIAICGLDCSTCPAFLAAKTDDQELRIRTAAAWSAAYGADIKAASVNCHGCLAEGGIQFEHCSRCGIRACARGKAYENCAACPDYPCAALGGLFEHAPDAKARLDGLRA